MKCGSCGATEGEFATRTRCMDCQRALWRKKHADRMGDPDRSARRREVLATYFVEHREEFYASERRRYHASR